MLKDKGFIQNENESSLSSTEDENQNSSLEVEKDNSLDGNPAWADCISNVLNSDKPKNKKSLILSRAKNLQKQIKEEKKPYDFEIEGEIKEEKSDKNELTKICLESIKKENTKSKSFNLRVKPSINDRERERALKKIATKGVVQLFNAVRIQQKEIDKELEKAGPLDHRKDAVLNNINKRKFLDVLMGGERAKSEFIDKPVKMEAEMKGESYDDNNGDQGSSGNNQKSEWSVLRDDFMTNKKLKHWDQESENSNDDEESKSDSDEND